MLGQLFQYMHESNAESPNRSAKISIPKETEILCRSGCIIYLCVPLATYLSWRRRGRGGWVKHPPPRLWPAGSPPCRLQLFSFCKYFFFAFILPIGPSVIKNIYQQSILLFFPCWHNLSAGWKVGWFCRLKWICTVHVVICFWLIKISNLNLFILFIL